MDADIQVTQPIRTLADCEEIIDRGLKTFIEVGDQLLYIRDHQLYRQTHKTFEAYCQERWKMGRRYANQLIEANKVAVILGSLTPKITNEAQAHELAPLLDDPDRMRQTWQEVTTRPDGKLTAGVIKTAVNAVLYPPPMGELDADEIGYDLHGEMAPSSIPPIIDWAEAIDSARQQIRFLRKSVESSSTLWQLHDSQRRTLVVSLRGFIDEGNAAIPAIQTVVAEAMSIVPALSDEAAMRSLEEFKESLNPESSTGVEESGDAYHYLRNPFAIAGLPGKLSDVSSIRQDPRR